MKVVPFILGDVHLGRRFTTGVPLNRKGDREHMVMMDFQHRVRSYDGPLLVQTGDLFDSFTVPEELVLFAARVVRRAATEHPHTIYVFYRGNHDASKDDNKASSFDVFKELLQDLKNVKVLCNPETIVFNENTSDETVFGFIPWHPFKSATELAEFLIKYDAPTVGDEFYDTIFGHWDVKDYGTTAHDFNMVPTKVLAEVTKHIVTGHVHLPTEFERDGVRVTVAGSMQPYAHGEDPGNSYYKTTDYASFAAYGPTEKRWCENLNLRIIVKDGEVPEPINCLSFTTKKAVDKDDGEAPDLDVSISDFNMDSLFLEALNERGVSTEVSELVGAKFKELRNAG